MSRKAVLALATLLVLALCVQILISVRATSPTFDEPYHILRSYVYLTTGDDALLAQGGHPPLANMVSVAPLWLRDDITLPLHQPGWPQVRQFKDLFAVADAFLWRIGNDADSIVLWARLPGVLLSVLGALLVFVWSRQLHGQLAALLGLLLYTFDPNIIAHSSVVTTDLGATVVVLATVYCLWRFCQRPRWSSLLLTGVLFGLAQGTKFSALFLAPICLVLLVMWMSKRSSSTPPLSLPLAQRLGGHPGLQRAYSVLFLCLVIFLVGAVVLWGVYGFRVSPLLPHEDSHPLLDRILPTSHLLVRRVAYSLAERFPVPAPAYFAELAWLQRYARSGHASFLMGEYGRSGWWFYFPVAFVIKTPIPVLILLLATVYQSIRHKRLAHQEAYFLVVPAALFFVSSMFSSIDIGYRNILPVLPLLFIYMGQVATRAAGRLARGALLVLCAWCVLGTVLLSPHYLAYFNELVGGPSNGYKYLVDSNLDWGQDLKHLKRYLDSRDVPEVHLSYFGTADPGYYGIHFLPMPTQPPAAGAEPAYYVISATSLQGVYAGSANGAHWLARYEPSDRVGYSMFVYHLP
jgi:hypothetical protein